jgi:hypothetical protein
MAAAILLYGVALTDSDTAWAELYESHDCKLSAATKAVTEQKRVKVKNPPFGCAVVGRRWWWFVTLPESCLLATGDDATPVAGLEVKPEWDESLRQFCDLFDLGKRQPAWYVTWVNDGEHRGHKLVVS